VFPQEKEEEKKEGKMMKLKNVYKGCQIKRGVKKERERERKNERKRKGVTKCFSFSFEKAIPPPSSSSSSFFLFTC